jgi:hypothetical protein
MGNVFRTQAARVDAEKIQQCSIFSLVEARNTSEADIKQFMLVMPRDIMNFHKVKWRRISS